MLGYLGDALAEVGASEEAVFLITTLAGQATAEQSAAFLAAPPSVEDIDELVVELEAMMDEDPEVRARIAERDPEVVAALLAEFVGDDVEEVEPAAVDPMAETSSPPPPDAFVDAGTPVAGEVYDMGTVGEATDGGEAGRTDAGEAQTVEAGTPEPGAEIASGEAGDAEEEPVYADDEPDEVAYTDADVPADAKAVVSWIAGAEDDADERDRAYAALEVESAREGGARKTVTDRLDRVLAPPPTDG